MVVVCSLSQQVKFVQVKQEKKFNTAVITVLKCKQQFNWNNLNVCPNKGSNMKLDDLSASVYRSVMSFIGFKSSVFVVFLKLLTSY